MAIGIVDTCPDDLCRVYVCLFMFETQTYSFADEVLFPLG